MNIDSKDIVVIAPMSIWGQFFSASYVARKARISRVTLWRNIKAGQIPMPQYRNIRGWPLFSYRQFEIIVFAWRASRKHKIKRRDLGAWVRERWED